MLATGGTSGIIRVWNPGSRELLNEFDEDTDEDDGALGVLTFRGGGVRAERVRKASASVIAPGRISEERIEFVVFGAPAVGPPLVASTCADGTVSIWDSGSGSQLRQLKQLPELEHVQSVALGSSPDSGLLLACGGRKALTSYESVSGSTAVWDLMSGELRHTLLSRDPVSAVTFGLTAEGTILLVAAGRNLVHVWNPISGRLVRELGGDFGGARALRCNTSAERELLVTVWGSRHVNTWEAVTGRRCQTTDRETGSIELETDTVRGRAAGAGWKIISTDGGPSFIVNDIGHDELNAIARGTAVDGTKLLAIAEGADVRIWSASTGRLYGAVPLVDVCSDLAFGREGELFVATGRALLSLTLA